MLRKPFINLGYDIWYAVGVELSFIIQRKKSRLFGLRKLIVEMMEMASILIELAEHKITTRSHTELPTP